MTLGGRVTVTKFPSTPTPIAAAALLADTGLEWAPGPGGTDNVRPAAPAQATPEAPVPTGEQPVELDGIVRQGRFVALRQDHGRSGRGGAGPGLGYIAEFDLDGRHLRTLGHTRRLNAPWGMAVAPEDFGPFSKRLLVGNFGDGTLVAFWLKKRAAERIFTRRRSAGHPDRWPLGPRLRQRREARTCELPVIHRRAEGRGRWPLRQPALYG